VILGDGQCPSLVDVVLSGLIFLKVLKGRHILE
jgi:hypothetical protein